MNTIPITTKYNGNVAKLLLDQRDQYFAQSAASIGVNVAEYPCKGAPRQADNPGFNLQQETP